MNYMGIRVLRLFVLRVVWAIFLRNPKQKSEKVFEFVHTPAIHWAVCPRRERHVWGFTVYLGGSASFRGPGTQYNLLFPLDFRGVSTALRLPMLNRFISEI